MTPAPTTMHQLFLGNKRGKDFLGLKLRFPDGEIEAVVDWLAQKGRREELRRELEA